MKDLQTTRSPDSFRYKDELCCNFYLIFLLSWPGPIGRQIEIKNRKSPLLGACLGELNDAKRNFVKWQKIFGT
jgi:hypothetical protein